MKKKVNRKSKSSFKSKSRKTPKLSSSQKTYKSYDLKNISFPKVPKTSLKSHSRSKKCNCKKLMEIKKKYKEGQRIMDQVDKYMGNK